MKKIFLFVFSVLLVQFVSAENKTYYNKNVKNYKQIIADVVLSEPKSVYDDVDVLEMQGITLSDIASFNYYQEVEFENGTLLLAWKFNEEYISDSFFKDSMKYLSEIRPSIRLFWKSSDGKYQKEVDKKYFKVGDKVESANIQYLKAEKLNIPDNGEGIKEKVILTELVQFQNKTILTTVTCLVIPFKTLEKESWNKATSSDQLVESFGMPDKIETYSFEWPDKKMKNGLYYTPEIKHPVSGEHWRYAKYPDLVIDISSGKKIRKFGTNRDYSFYEQVVSSY